MAVLAAALGASALFTVAAAAFGETDFVNPHTLLFVAFYGGGVGCAAAALILIARVIPRWLRTPGTSAWNSLLPGLTVVAVLWLAWITGALGLTAS